MPLDGGQATFRVATERGETMPAQEVLGRLLLNGDVE